MQPAETHTHRVRPGVDLCQFGVTRIWPSPISLLPCRPFRQTGLARGGVRRGATKTSHRDGTDCDLRRCGGALPFPHTVTHFSRISIGISFLLSIKPPPKLKLPRLLGSAVSPAPTWAGLGRARSIHPHSYFRSRSLVGWAGGFAPSTKEPSKAYPPRQQFATTFKVVTFLQPLSRTHPDSAVPARGESDRIFGISLLIFPFAWICDDRQGQGDTEHITHLEFRICHHHHWDTRGDICIIMVLVFKRAISCHIFSHLFYT